MPDTTDDTDYQDDSLYNAGFEELVGNFYDYNEQREMSNPEVNVVAELAGEQALVYLVDRRRRASNCIVGGVENVTDAQISAESLKEFETVADAKPWWSEVTKEVAQLVRRESNIEHRLNNEVEINTETE